MKEKEYKEEIVRLENVLLEKENFIKDLQDKIAILNLRKYIYNQGEGNINKYYYEMKTNIKNNAIYDALILILKYIKSPKKDWYHYAKDYIYEINNLILQLENERDLNND